VASRQGRHDVRCAKRIRMRVGNSECKFHSFHERHVRRIISNTCTFRSGDPQTFPQLLKCKYFVGCALDHVLDAELATANVDHLGASARDDRNLDARRGQTLDPMTIAHVEDLQGLTARAKKQTPVGQRPVDVQNQQSNSGRRFTRYTGHVSHNARAEEIVHVQRADQPPIGIGDG